MNNEVLKYFTVAAYFAIVTFLLLVIAINVTSTLKESHGHKPLWFGFVAFVVFAAVAYLITGESDAVLFMNIGELVCLTGLALLYNMRYYRKRQAEHSFTK